MIVFNTCKLPNNLEEHIIEDSKKEFTPITAYTLVNGSVDGYFYKKINMPKVRQRYNGNYINLLIEYYNKLKSIIECNKMAGIIINEDDVYEVLELINIEEILCQNNNISFEEMKNLLGIALEGINRLERNNDRSLGIDSAIWNYSKKGVFFDFDPPKIIRGNSLFITDDEDYKKRVLYRNFNYNGMKANTLGTVFLGNESWNFNITGLPKNYAKEYIDMFLYSINNLEERKKFESLIFGDKDVLDFGKHPINIIRKELRK